ncbi:hypothetical protein DUNSADRAFT_4703 [Dunaliella salina]|uniref:Protein transport protein SEC23 n=1 Tax=Dunaliella salina TaxID=3046 RepID=A0ABQ7H7K4_DUNSA|nr:hypothetical protein DUNSADRAFT_4703 [Dunaliella salina]|eukprot:KAF5842819.1 hypothetical protein DUNSADRAFT_4703 [Dunaliella salina]
MFTSSTVIGLRAFANHCGVPLAALFDAQPSEETPKVVRSPSPPRCRNCRAFWSQYCMVNLQRQMWHCACCGVGNISKSALANPDPTAYPELYNDTVEYHRVLHEGGLQRPRARKHIVVAVDATMDAALLHNLQTTVLQTLQSELEPGTLVSAIAFDSSVAVLDLAPGRHQVPSLVLSGSAPLDQPGRDALAQQAGLIFTAEFPQCANRLAAALSSVRAFEIDKPMRPRSRCLAVAVQVGLELLAKSAAGPHALEPHTGVPHSMEQTGIQPQLAPGSRLLVFLGGPITKGAEAGVNIPLLHPPSHPCGARSILLHSHLLCLCIYAGAEAGVNIPLLTHLVDGSQGGQLHLQRGFGPSCGLALKACLSSCLGVRGALDVFCSGGLRLAQCMGALDEQEKLGAPTSPPGPWLSPSACYVGNIVAGRGIVTRFELTQDLPSSEPDKPTFAHVQVVLYYHDLRTSELVARVTSKRLEVVSRASQFLRSVNAPVAAIVAAKRLALDAQCSGALGGDPKKLESARLAVCAQVSLIAARLGKDIQMSPGLLGIGARKEKQWPSDLLPLAHGLFNLQRSRMLAAPQPPPHAVHPSERLLLMLQLLAAGRASAEAQVLPGLYAVLPEQQGPLVHPSKEQVQTSSGASPQSPSQPQQAQPQQAQAGGGSGSAYSPPVQPQQAQAGGESGPAHSPPVQPQQAQAGGESRPALSPLAQPQQAQAGGESGSAQGMTKPVLVSVGAPFDVVGVAALQAGSSNTLPGPKIPALLLDAGPNQLLCSGCKEDTHIAAALALAAAASANRAPQLLLVRPAAPAAPMGEPQQQCDAVSEAEFLAALQPVCRDAWPQQQAQLHQASNSLAGMITQGRDPAALSDAAAKLLAGLSSPSFLQWGKGMGIAFLPTQEQ